MSNEIIIDTDVPIPDGNDRGRPKKHPFSEMDVGDSYLYMEEEYTPELCRKMVAAAIMSDKLKIKKWTSRKEETEDGVFLRIWRIK